MMGLSRKALVVAFMVFFLVLAPKGSMGRQLQFFGISDSFFPKSPAVDDDKVEQILLDCGLQLKEVKEIIKTVDLSFLAGLVKDFSQIYLETESLTKNDKVKEVAPPSPHIEHYFLECLSKQNHPVHDAGEGNDLRNSISCYLESLLGWCPALRRHLVAQFLQTTVPTPAPAPVISAAYASAPSPDLGSRAPIYSPAPSSISEPANSPSPDANSLTPDAFPPTHAPSGLFPQILSTTSPDSTPTLLTKKQENINKIIVFAVASSIAGTTFLAALLFVLYNKCRKNKGYAGNSLRDDTPLPSLSLSDFSGSSRKFFGLSEKNKLGALSHKAESIQVGNASSLNVGSNDAPPYKLDSGFSNASMGLSNAPTNRPAEKPTSQPPPPPPPPPPPLPPPVVALPVQKATPVPIPPPPPPSKKPSAPSPPPPKAAFPSRPPQSNPSSSRVPRPSPPSTRQLKNAKVDMNAPKAKLKPFFWDKVPANPDKSMVWNKIKSGSFQFDEEKIETLFGYASADKTKDGGRESSSKSSAQFVRILDGKKSQNLAISLKAMNVKIEEVCDALMEGNELPVELLQQILKMAPTSDEELRLRLYTGDPSELGPAEQFLKALLDIPFAFQRLDVLLFMASLAEEVSTAKESFSTLEVACGELKNSRLFLKLLEAVLKTGNRMNDGTFRGGAHAFKLDTLLKLADVKGSDGKTTLLHFVVQEITRTEGVRAVRRARERSGSISSVIPDDFTDDSLHESEDYYRKLGLKIVSGLGDELQNVKNAACLDADALTMLVANLGQRLVKMKEFLNTSMKSLDEESGFHDSLKCFVEKAETRITFLLEEEKRIRSLVKKTMDFFHGNEGKNEGLRLFVIVRDFLVMLDKACKEVREEPRNVKQEPENRDKSSSSVPDPQQLLFPAMRDQQVDSSSSDDES